MSKEYFSHDYGTRSKVKMAALIESEGSRGYGLFWIIVELMHEDSTKWLDLEEYTYLAIKKESKEDIDYVREFVKKCIEVYKVFMTEGNKFTTERVLRNIEKREEIKEKRAAAGKKSAESKASKSDNNQQNSTSVDTVLNTFEQKPTKEKKRKESKGKVSISPNGLVPPALPGPDKKVLYSELVVQLKGKEVKEVWTGLKGFITTEKPDFIEPYWEAWNLFAANYKLPMIEQISPGRQRKFSTRIREPGFDFIRILEAIKLSPLLKGEKDRDWKVSFDWILENDKNYLKIIEGNYD